MRSLAVVKLQCPSEGAYPLLNLRGARAMFGFRPYVPGFNAEPPAEPQVPGFRMNADGTVRTDDAASGQPRSYTPVGWSSVSDQLGNAEIALGVEPQQVIPGQTESADRWHGSDTAMRSMPVVSVHPER